eukprot:symbB.v1.2.023504.t1/scaffold2074.1/size157288/4
MIRQTEEGILVTCPNVLDRTKAIFIEPSRQLQRGAEATMAEIAQLRSVVGSLAWLGRACRPDLSFVINQLQSVQGKARVQDLLQANKVLSHALKTRSKGVFYPAKPFLFEEAILISVNDASHAASLEQVHIGQAGGLESTRRGRWKPENRATLVKWIDTKSMVADALTKEMKPEQLSELTSKGWLQVTYASSHL